MQSAHSRIIATATVILAALFLLFQPTTALAGTRANTVEFVAGSYSGNGSAGQNTNTDLTFPAQQLKLAESSADIKSAYVQLDMVIEAYTDYTGDHTGHKMAFDACASPCTANAFSGTGRVLRDESTVLTYSETESNHVRLLQDVTSEAQMAAYTGGGSTLNYQVGYHIKRATAANSISNARAKLIVTYTYDDTSANRTNTIIYPLDAQQALGEGSFRLKNVSGCTKDSNCPLLDYNVTVPEIGSGLQSWFEISSYNDDNASNDITGNVNIEGTDTDSGNYILEAALGGGAGNDLMFYIVGLAGYGVNATQTLEWYFGSSGSQGIMGGEAHQTYTYAANAATKTKTVSYPIGVITNDLVTAPYSASANVYLPEDGVDVKAAWFRLYGSSTGTGANTLGINTKMGSNSPTSNWPYTLTAPSVVVNPTYQWNVAVPSSEFTELEGASASTPKTALITFASGTAGLEGFSGEFMVTYTYTGETSYQQSLRTYGSQSTANPSMSGQQLSSALTFPDSGTKTKLASGSRVSFTYSDPEGAMGGSQTFSDVSLADDGETCSTSDAYATRHDSTNAFLEYIDIGGHSNLDTTDGAQYEICWSEDGGGGVNTGAKFNSQILYTYKVDGAAEAPTVTPESGDRNPDLSGSAYSGGGSHTKTDWKIVTSSDCGSGTVAWEDTNDTTNKTSVVVNTVNGSFVGPLSGETKLAESTGYWACARYYDGAYTDWSAPAALNTNSAPVASNASINSGAATLTPDAGTTTEVTGTFTVTDSDGCDQLAAPKVKIYRSGAGHEGVDDNNNRYTMSCDQDVDSCEDSADTDATYTCTANVQYYIESTDGTSPYPTENWEMRAEPEDTTGPGTVNTDTIDVASVAAVSSTSGISFDTMSLGTDTGAVNETVVVTNTGNVRLDLNVSAFGNSFGDGLSMDCESGDITVGNLKQSLTGFTYSSGGTPLTSSYVEIDADIVKSTGSASSVTLYHGYATPASGAGGACAGQLALSPVADSIAD
ncbi:hypothetical protein ACFL2M_00860 [Patescibacteria group bacterium]